MAEEEEVDNESNQFQSVQVTIVENSLQTGLEAGSECEPLLAINERNLDDVEDDPPYHDAYRNGNFGIKRGKINFTRAERWSVAHFVSALIMTLFTLPCVILLLNHYYGVGQDLRDFFTAITILCCIIGLTMSSCSCYLSYSLVKIRRPLFFLLLVRLLAVLELLFLVAGISLTTAVAFDSHSDAFTVLCSFLVISMAVEVIVTGSWLFHWWKCCGCCGALKSFCIFEPGEPLAPGVSDPPTGIFYECAYVCCRSIYKIDWNFII